MLLLHTVLLPTAFQLLSRPIANSAVGKGGGGLHLGKLMGHEPGDGLSLHLRLVVEALDGDERLTQGVGAHDIPTTTLWDQVQGNCMGIVQYAPQGIPNEYLNNASR